jgi:octaprenyl-diphosphate synthase
MQRGTPQQRNTIRHAIEHGAVDELESIVSIVRSTGALEITRAAAAAEAQCAIDCAMRLPRNPYAEGLVQLAAQLLQRRN